MELTAEEVRVLGCLVEKAATTPDNYPLSTNALTSACNQKNNRDPVVAYTDRVVTETLLLLRPAGLARTVTGSGRVEKHRHTLDEAWELTDRQLAVLAVLMLRGPNSPGELKTRTERYVSFDDLGDIQRVLQNLAERPEPLVANIGRLSGQSQDRWTHLLTGEPVLTDGHVLSGEHGLAGATVDVASTTVGAVAPRSSPRPTHSALEARVEELERRLARLESELGIETDAPPTSTPNAHN